MVTLITHTDFDGLACAVIVTSMEDVGDIKFTEPGLVQKRDVEVPKGAIITDLPWHPNAGMWFDHHASVKPPEKFEGAFDPHSPSAARVVYKYYDNDYVRGKFSELVDAADKIDTAQLTEDDVHNPSGYYLISISLDAAESASESFAYRRYLIELLRKKTLGQVLADPKVSDYCQKKIAAMKKAEALVPQYTAKVGKVALVDFREAPAWIENAGARWHIYLQNKDCIASLRVRKSSTEGHVDISVGKNVFHSGGELGVNLGAIMKAHGGGGHANAAGASVKEADAQAVIDGVIADINKAAAGD